MPRIVQIFIGFSEIVKLYPKLSPLCINTKIQTTPDFKFHFFSFKMSALEYLSPLTYSKFYLNSNSNFYHCQGFSYSPHKSRFCFKNSCNYVANSVSVPSIRAFKFVNLSRSYERLNLWGGYYYYGVRKSCCNNVRASGQEGDSGEKSEAAKAGSEGQGVKNSTSSGSNRRREKNGRGGWWWNSKGGKWRWQPIVQAQEIGVLLLQLGIVIFVMRLLRPGVPLPGSEPRTPTTFVSVPYSDFLSKINGNQVQKVEVDGVHIMFKLKSDLGSVHDGEFGGGSRLQESESLIKSVAPTKRIVYTTTRPSDIKTPYEKMLENEVEFGSPDKRSGGFFNSALVRKLLF